MLIKIKKIFKKKENNKDEPLYFNSGLKQGIKCFFTLRWLFAVLGVTLLTFVCLVSLILAYGETLDLTMLKNGCIGSYLEDSKGKSIARLDGMLYESITLEELTANNPLLVDTLISVEDGGFTKHPGFNIASFVRSAVVNLLHGERKQGGSTLTMQLANVVLNSHERTYDRKLRQIAAALHIERELDKAQILNAYFNDISFLPHTRGVKVAVRLLCRKDVSKEKLTPAEVATVVGLLKGTHDYCPLITKNRDAAKKRRDVVLKVMAESPRKLITKSEQQTATQEKLVANPAWRQDARQLDNQEPALLAYKHMVLEELKRDYGITKQDLEKGNYRIKTGLDLAVQKRTCAELDKHLAGDSISGGSITLDAKTGLICAVGGGAEFSLMKKNEAFQVIKPTGSSIKPLTVYAPYIENCNASSDTLVNDVDVAQYVGVRPRNWGNNPPHGWIPLSEAIEQSWNMAAMWTLRHKVGVEEAMRYGKELGLVFKGKDINSPAALGIGGFQEIQGGASPLLLAQAYTVFANQGIFTEVHAVHHVYVENKEILPNKNYKRKAIFSERTVKEMTKLLQGVARRGTAKEAQLGDGRHVAVKTGSTNCDKEIWIAGYTPEALVTVVMLYSTQMPPSDKWSGSLVRDAVRSRHIFRSIMEEAHRGREIRQFG
ncbi:MAG: hypothetical protein RLZ12_531 [Bacillota bacterium]